MDFFNYFQFGGTPSGAIHGTYHYSLVALSYVIACAASYVALDFAGNLRIEEHYKRKWLWLIGGAFAMGAGIWSMHFIGMLAFIMPLPITYTPLYTALSLLVAIISAAYALFLIRDETKSTRYLIDGGIILVRLCIISACMPWNT